MATNLQLLKKRAFDILCEIKEQVEEKVRQVYGVEVNASFIEAPKIFFSWGRTAMDVFFRINDEDIAAFGIKMNWHWHGRLLFSKDLWSWNFNVGHRNNSTKERKMFVNFSLVPSLIAHAYFLNQIYKNLLKHYGSFFVSVSVGCIDSKGVFFRFSLPDNHTPLGGERLICHCDYVGDEDVTIILMRRRFADSSLTTISTVKAKAYEIDFIQSCFENVVVCCNSFYL